MSTIAELRLPTDDAVLATTFEYVPGLTCFLEQVIVAQRYGVWFKGATPDTISTALGADPSLEAYRHLSSTEEDGHLFSIAFDGEPANPLEATVEEGGSVLAAAIEDGYWQVRIRVHERSAVGQIYDRLEDAGSAVDIARLGTTERESSSSVELTEQQYRAIHEAIEHGYFEIPRRISLEELATELEISHQALSERLRRAYQTLAARELDATDRERIDRLETES